VGDAIDRTWVEELLKRNRYLVLATANGDQAWVAPVEYVLGPDLTFCFFSPANTRHVQHLEANPSVAVAVFDQEQPDYAGGLTANLNGVQMEATARRLEPFEYPEDVKAGIEALEPPMPPYEVFHIEPTAWFVPWIEDGVNVRKPVDMG
jgi:uncharacterized protein YhbP (UPF0306 family)